MTSSDEVLKSFEQVPRKGTSEQKMNATSLDVKIRTLSLDDLPAIKEIEKKILFSRNQEYIDVSVPEYLKKGSKGEKLGAEVNGKLVGFIIGTIRYWEAGWIDDPKSGWIVAMGVLPEYQGRGIGKILGEKLIENFRKEDISSLKAIVDWDQPDLIAYFKSLGFEKNTKIVLESRTD